MKLWWFLRFNLWHTANNNSWRRRKTTTSQCRSWTWSMCICSLTRRNDGRLHAVWAGLAEWGPLWSHVTWPTVAQQITSYFLSHTHHIIFPITTHHTIIQYIQKSHQRSYSTPWFIYLLSYVRHNLSCHISHTCLFRTINNISYITWTPLTQQPSSSTWNGGIYWSNTVMLYLHRILNELFNYIKTQKIGRYYCDRHREQGLYMTHRNSPAVHTQTHAHIHTHTNTRMHMHARTCTHAHTQ